MGRRPHDSPAARAAGCVQARRASDEKSGVAPARAGAPVRREKRGMCDGASNGDRRAQQQAAPGHAAAAAAACCSGLQAEGGGSARPARVRLRLRRVRLRLQHLRALGALLGRRLLARALAARERQRGQEESRQSQQHLCDRSRQAPQTCGLKAGQERRVWVCARTWRRGRRRRRGGRASWRAGRCRCGHHSRCAARSFGRSSAPAPTCGSRTCCPPPACTRTAGGQQGGGCKVAGGALSRPPPRAAGALRGDARLSRRRAPWATPTPASTHLPRAHVVLAAVGQRGVQLEVVGVGEFPGRRRRHSVGRRQQPGVQAVRRAGAGGEQQADGRRLRARLQGGQRGRGGGAGEPGWGWLAPGGRKWGCGHLMAHWHYRCALWTE